MIKDNEYINRIKAIIASVVFHIILIALFFLITIVTPIPPFPDAGGSGLEINYGTSDDGMGDIQPDESSPKPIAVKPAEMNDDEVITQEKEETTSIDVKKDNKKKKTDKIPDVKTEKIVQAATPLVDTKSLYSKKKNTGNEGETGKSGDQGKIYGDRYVKTHGNGGSGGGNGTGFGNGNGNGIGNGNGTGIGIGNKKGKSSPISYTLKGRKSRELPKPPNTFKEGGIIVVDITVDRKGNVIKAIPGGRGTTSTNETLYSIAKRAAMQAKFDPNPDAAEEQKGTITYNFIIGN
ncbi:MAG: hypothetical protein Q8880_03915 [Bacteroidota bacterium]|nr:hypothetical protein [Bacteroidota bacterium]